MQNLRSFVVALGFLIMILFPLLRIASLLAGHYLVSVIGFVLGLAGLLLAAVILTKKLRTSRAE